MAPDEEPFTCNIFMPPPDEAPLVEIKQMLQYMLRVVNDFHLAIVTLQASYHLADALDLIAQLREAMSKECRDLELAFTVVTDCAQVYSAVPSEVVTKRQEAETHIGYLELRTESLVGRFRDIDAGITLGAEYFRRVVEKIAASLADIEPGSPDVDDPRTFLFNSRNPQVAETLLQVFARTAKASLKLADYYHALNEHIKGLVDSFNTLQPSPEEVEIIDKLWNEHRQRSYRLMSDLVEIGFLMHRTKPYVLPSEPPYRSTSIAPPDPFAKPTTSPQTSPPPVRSVFAVAPTTTSGGAAQPEASSSRAISAIPTSPSPLDNLRPPSPLSTAKSKDPQRIAPSGPSPLTAGLPAKPSLLQRLRSCISLRYFRD